MIWDDVECANAVHIRFVLNNFVSLFVWGHAGGEKFKRETSIITRMRTAADPVFVVVVVL